MVEETSLLALLITLIHFSVLLSFNAKLVRIRASLLAQLVKNPPTMQETWFDSWVGMIHWRRDRLPTPVFLGFPGGSAGIESACSVGDLDSVPVLGRSPGEGNSYPFQCSGLETSMDCICIVPGVTKSRTRLSDFHSSGLVFCLLHFRTINFNSFM